MKIWIVLPAYNEEKALPALLDNLIETFSEEFKNYSIIVVNDGSKDNTGAILKRYAETKPVIPIEQPKNMGLAETIRTGLMKAVELASDKDLILTMDADNTHPAGLAIRMIRNIKEGNDVVIASRYRYGSYIRGLSLSRRVLSWGASILFRTLFPTPGVRDFTCGYRVYRASILKEVIAKYGRNFISAQGFSCMVDLLLVLRKHDVIFSEVPLILRYDLKPTNSSMKVMKTVVETLTLLLRRRFLGN